MKDDQAEELALALGARREGMRSRPARGPLDVVALRDELGRRLRSTGGRPTDPALALSRQVRFSEVTWERLRSMADEIAIGGPRVGPAQVAALLVESSLEDEGEWHLVFHASRDHQLLTEGEAAEAAGVPYRTLDDWYRRAWIVPARRVGRVPEFSIDEVIRARWLGTVATKHREGAVADIRGHDLTDRFLVTTDHRSVATARTRRHLLDIVEDVDGDHLVIDQLARRRPYMPPGAPSDSREESSDELIVRRVG